MSRNLLAELQGRNDNNGASTNPFETNPFAVGYVDVENPPATINENQTNDDGLSSFGKKLWESSSEEEDETPLDFNDSSVKFGEINDQIDRITELTARIKKKVRKYEQMTNQSEMNDMHRQITNEFNEARECSSRVAIRLKELRSELFDTVKKGRDADTTLMQWQRNQFQLCKSKYEAALQDYMEADETFRSVKENRTRRLAQTMDVELTQEEVEEFVRDPTQAQKMLEQQLASDALLENLAHLEETRDAMKSIEQGVHDILEMWKDFNAILEIQQEQIDSIEANIVRAHVKVKKGVEYLEKGEQYQQKARKNQCILLVCCAVALVILAGGLGFGLS